eukprot:TRINITY_DN1854_c0_g1_i4.p1 TRINITY_DN1854_c0_g1~~TRINITY_DN1854_c0_g1_i4.p1  ORF type:complete len:278 (-),score=45.04 TRINITY_DN1854_c0_g1_i4:224-1057(-)
MSRMRSLIFGYRNLHVSKRLRSGSSTPGSEDSAYLVYCSEAHKMLKRNNPNMNAVETKRIIDLQWNELSNYRKGLYRQMAIENFQESKQNIAIEEEVGKNAAESQEEEAPAKAKTIKTEKNKADNDTLKEAGKDALKANEEVTAPKAKIIKSKKVKADEDTMKSNQAKEPVKETQEPDMRKEYESLIANMPEVPKRSAYNLYLHEMSKLRKYKQGELAKTWKAGGTKLKDEYQAKLEAMKEKRLTWERTAAKDGSLQRIEILRSKLNQSTKKRSSKS